MSKIPSPSVKNPNRIIALDDVALANAASEYSKVLSIGGFENKQIEIGTKDLTSGKEVDIDFMVSNQHDVDFEAASTMENHWTLCQVKDHLNQTSSNGTINIADADENKDLALNTDGFRYLCIKTTFTGTGQSLRVSVDLFGKHKEDN